MIKVEVKDATVATRSGTSKKGQPYSMRSQEAWAHTVNQSGNLNPYPEKITITLEGDQAAYQPGAYQLMPASLYVGDYGSLRLGRPVLAPIKQQASA
jgi:hypothetical protein